MCFTVGNQIDFNSIRRSVVFRDGVVIRNVSIPITDDDIVEAIENFSLSIQIQRQFSNIGVIQGTPAMAIGLITDDDGMCCVSMYTTFLMITV